MTDYLRGHRLLNVQEARYADTGKLVEYGYNAEKDYKYANRNCKKCKLPPTPEGHDPCLGTLPGVKFACCGHGVEGGYIMFENGIRLYFDLIRIEKSGDKDARSRND